MRSAFWKADRTSKVRHSALVVARENLNIYGAFVEGRNQRSRTVSSVVMDEGHQGDSGGVLDQEAGSVSSLLGCIEGRLQCIFHFNTHGTGFIGSNKGYIAFPMRAFYTCVNVLKTGDFRRR